MEILKRFYSLENQIAIVTGASQGLGQAIVNAYAMAGCKVYMISRNEKKLQQNKAHIEQLGGKAQYFAGDVTDLDFIEETVNEIANKEGRIDILVNNAGVAVAKKAFDIDEDDWQTTIDTNLKSVFFFSKAVAKRMKEQNGGRIINIASVAGAVGDVSISPYCASKGGVIQLTKAFALEWARYNILVNAIGPGYVRTGINDEAFNDEKFYNYVIGKTPLRRLGQADEIAGAALYLASPIASYITGQTFFVDGGWTAQ
jgi:2-deoxy-D-gluconate 3-dehydrogenase